MIDRTDALDVAALVTAPDGMVQCRRSDEPLATETRGDEAHDDNPVSPGGSMKGRFALI
jgi:hypothetical protein